MYQQTSTAGASPGENPGAKTGSSTGENNDGNAVDAEYEVVNEDK